MGFFQKKKISNSGQNCSGVDVADELLKIMFTMGVGVSDNPASIEAQKILDESAKKHGGAYDIQEVLCQAVDLVGEPKTPKDRRVLAGIYCSSHTEYTLYAIRALRDYISNDLDYEPYENISKLGMTQEMIKLEYKSQVYEQLGKLYERAYDFDKAEGCYRIQAKYDTWSHFPYLNLSELYRKKNEPDKSIAILEKAKKHPSYKSNEINPEPDALFYSVVVDNFLKEAKARKARNYVYRPKGHKEFLDPDEDNKND